MRTEITKEWLDLAFSSDGLLSLHVDDIRQFLIKRLETTTSDNEICRMFESCTGYMVRQQDQEDRYKIVCKG